MITVHPEFDPEHCIWHLTDGSSIFEARSLRELKRQLGPGYRIEGYYPNGYDGPIERPKEPLFSDAKMVMPPIMKSVRMHNGPGRKAKYDHETILNMWARGETGPAIGAALGMTNWKRVGSIISMARKRGDKRAESRIGNHRLRRQAR